MAVSLLSDETQSVERLLIPVEVPLEADPRTYRDPLVRLNRLLMAYLETGMSEYEISRRLHGYQPPRPSASDKDTWPPREAQP